MQIVLNWSSIYIVIMTFAIDDTKRAWYTTIKYLFSFSVILLILRGGFVFNKPEHWSSKVNTV